MIISHNHRKYKQRWDRLGAGRYNGAFYYSKEIVRNIIPNVKTDRNWITVNLPGTGCDHSIVFIHNNLHPQNYDWLSKYKDIVLVCGVKETCEKVKHLGRAIYLPLSVDTEELEKYKSEEKTGAAFAGRPSKRTMQGVQLPLNIPCIEGLPRDRMLKRMSHYKTIYAVGRTAIEAKALGCNVAAYDARYPDPEVWQVLDNREAAAILQKELDKIDRKPDKSWTKAELVQYAEEHGIETGRRDTKANLLEKINGRV